MRLRLKLFFIIFVLSGCSDFNEYSPNQVGHHSPEGLNSANLRKLYSSVPDDTMTIAFIGDSQNFYDEVDHFVEKVNALTMVDLVIIAGDLSDYGLLQEFKWIRERLKKLNKPYIGVIGNHDLVANGEAVYKRMFGPLDFSFIYDHTKFIIHNTNSREYLSGNVPDLEWLARELNPEEDVTHYVGISHVPPFSGDFDPALENEYNRLLRSTPGFLLSLHGHIHRHTDGYPYGDGIRYITGQSFEQRGFVLLRISNGNVLKAIVEF